MTAERALEPIAERYPWEQQEGEPTVWFDRFTYYKLMGATKRTVQRAYREHLLKSGAAPQNKLPSHQWAEVAKEYHWKERAEAWDAEQQLLLAAAAEEEFSEGYALAHERVRALKNMAAKLETYLLDPKNTHVAARTIEQYRGLLDDLAREMGHRAKETRIVGAGGGPIVIETHWGRGGSASSAWDAQVTAITEEKEEPDEAG